jgi:hypothetical protein
METVPFQFHEWTSDDGRAHAESTAYTNAVKTLPETNPLQLPVPKNLVTSTFFLVEMGRLELPTPYMRSKCSTS